MTVRLRKDTGKWLSDITYEGQRIITPLKLVTSRKQAEIAEAVILTKLFQKAYGLEPKPDKVFENFVIESYLPYSEANKKSFANDVSICKVLVRYFKGKPLRKLTAASVESFKQWLLAKPIEYGPVDDRKQRRRSLATVNNHLRVLSKIFSLAVDAELLDTNPCFRVRKFKPNNRRLRVLSFAEEGRLFKQLKDNDLLKRVVLTALHTGLRRGEIFNLQWSDVDFSRNRIIVRKTKSSTERFVPINKTLRRTLQSICSNEAYVFLSPRTGGKLFDLKKSFRKAVDDAEIENFRFHDLRHTFATRLADSGVRVQVLMEILGHADVRTTMIYTHTASAAMHEAVEKLNRNKKAITQRIRNETRTAGPQPAVTC